jgi:hypothetical protein
LRLTRSTDSGQAPPPRNNAQALTFLVSEETATANDLH